MAQILWPDFWFICTSILSAIGGLYGLRVLLVQPSSRFNFFLVGAVVIVLSTAVGLLLSSASVLSIAYEIWVIAIDYVHTTVAELALAQAYANAFALVLWLLGNWIHRSGIMVFIHEDIANFLRAYSRTSSILILIILVCQYYLLQKSVVVYGGKNGAMEGEPTHPLLALIIPLTSVLPFLFGYHLRGCFRARQWAIALLLIILITSEFYWFFLFGRRSIFYFFTFLFVGFSYGYVLPDRLTVRNILPLIISLFLILKIADTYHKMRTVYGFKNLQRMSAVEGLTGLQTIDDDQYSAIRKVNIAARSAYSLLALGQFINLFSTTKQTHLSGKVLTNSLLFATPSDFFVNKNYVLVKEALYETTYSLKLTDITETLYLESFIDFGWSGFLIYTGFIFCLIYGIYRSAYACRNPLLSLLVGCTILSAATSMIETDMITFLSTIRVILLGCLIMNLFFRRKTAIQSMGEPVA